MKNNRVLDYGQDILEDSRYQVLRGLRQHGQVSVLEHSMRVAAASLVISDFIRKFHIQCSEKELVRGALLHDYFLYDWHDRKITLKDGPFALHGFTHPEEALRNASRDYELTSKEKDIIEKHMFPLTLTRIPSCREAWVVMAADKYCSLMETITMRSEKHVSGA